MSLMYEILDLEHRIEITSELSSASDVELLLDYTLHVRTPSGALDTSTYSLFPVNRERTSIGRRGSGCESKSKTSNVQIDGQDTSATQIHLHNRRRRKNELNSHWNVRVRLCF